MEEQEVTMIQIYLNGQEIEILEDTTVEGLFKEKQMATSLLVVLINGRRLKKSEYKRVLEDGDDLMFYYYMGGG